MAQIDKSYKELLETILSKGFRYEDPNRKDIYRIQIPTYTFKHDFKDGFPAISTKQLFWKGVVGELLWFLRGDTNIKYLVDNGINIWNKDAYNYTELRNANIPAHYDVWLKEIKKSGADLGRIYGAQFRSFMRPKTIFKKPIPIILTDYPKEIECDYSSNKSNLVGTEHSSNNCGDYTVINEYYIGKQQRFTVQFHKTGFQKEDVTKQNILKTKQIKDIFAPTVYGVATIGDADRSDKLYNKLKPTWEGMISRCYNEKDPYYYLYGGKGVYVDNSWLRYDNFLRDFVAIEGYNNKLKNWKEYSLDKDILRAGYYSVDTCIWATKKQQVEYSRRFKPFKTNLDIKNEDAYKGIDQIANLIKGLKEKPLSTQHIVTAWNPAELDNMALPPCHWSFEILVEPIGYSKVLKLMRENGATWNIPITTEKFLEIAHRKWKIPKYQFTLKWHQRSVDTFLGR